MKKTTLTLLVLGLLIISVDTIIAKNEESGSKAQNAPAESVRNTEPDLQKNAIQYSPALRPLTPAGAAVENQNEVRTQNQGEDSQLQIMTQEQETATENSTLNRAQTNLEKTQAVENRMSEVARQVQEIQATRTEQGGIGEQVREIARDQQQTHAEIEGSLEALDKRKGLAKGLLGPDYQALKNIRQQMVQNSIRIQQLQKIQTELVNEGDNSDLQLAIQALEAENVALGEKILAEEQTRSAFGWLFRLFAR